MNASPKTKKNISATFQMVWKSARNWSYVAHDATSGVTLPKRSRVARRFFSLVEVQRILEAAPEPHRTFYWLAVEPVQAVAGEELAPPIKIDISAISKFRVPAS